ncbi:MAG: protein kinase [Burkholderiales bacterium]|nr:protein kinase [Burkholderiales bacterium]
MNDSSTMERLGRYQIREIIGEGAMACVYKAFDPEINRPLAIKLLKAQLRLDGEYRNRFLREAKGAGVLSHPNIVTVFDVGEDQGHPYIAMELVEGGTLGDEIKSRKVLTTRDVVDIGIQLARALDYAHKKGIIHRDVKPGNIMRVADSNTIKVADFGICRIDDSEATDVTQQTQIGNVLGTPHYMSPEQVIGEKVDSRSDLFSAGVVLYQLLTGHLPFEGDTLISVAYKITKTDPPSLDKVRADLPLSLRRVIERALKKQPDKRFQSGEEFAQALVAVQDDLAEEEARKGKTRGGIPLALRWALTMAAVVAITMTVTATILYKRQYAAMMDQVKDYGGSLAKFTATQDAVPLLSEDWAAMDVFIQETLGRQQNFSYMSVVDHQGIVRASNVAAEVNQKYIAPQATAVASNDPQVTVQSHAMADGREVLDFATPVLFQGKTIGSVHLGIYAAPLTAVANLMLVLLAILTAVTVAAVAGGTYLLAQRLAQPIRVLRNSLGELASGRLDYRIGESRKDEFGELYKEFDRTAKALEDRYDAIAPTPSPPSGEAHVTHAG